MVAPCPLQAVLGPRGAGPNPRSEGSRSGETVRFDEKVTKLTWIGTGEIHAGEATAPHVAVRLGVVTKEHIECKGRCLDVHCAPVFWERREDLVSHSQIGAAHMRELMGLREGKGEGAYRILIPT
jgi:hypothetical protein